MLIMSEEQFFTHIDLSHNAISNYCLALYSNPKTGQVCVITPSPTMLGVVRYGVASNVCPSVHIFVSASDLVSI